MAKISEHAQIIGDDIKPVCEIHRRIHTIYDCGKDVPYTYKIALYIEKSDTAKPFSEGGVFPLIRIFFNDAKSSMLTTALVLAGIDDFTSLANRDDVNIKMEDDGNTTHKTIQIRCGDDKPKYMGFVDYVNKHIRADNVVDYVNKHFRTDNDSEPIAVGVYNLKLQI